MTKTTCTLQAVAFLDLLAVSLIIPLIPNYARQNGANHIQVGLLGSVYAGFQLVSGPLIGSLSDIKGRKLVLIVTISLCSLTYSMFGFTSSVIVMLLLRAILGLFKQTQGLVRALVADYVKDEKEQSILYGRLAAVSGAGMTLGPSLGGHIIEDNPENGFQIVAAAVGAAFALNTGLAYLLPNTKQHPSKRKQAKNQNDTNILQSALTSLKQSVIELCKIQWSAYWQIFLLKAFLGIAMGVYYSNYAVYLKTVYKLSPKYVGYVISFQGTIGVLSSYFIGFINSFYTHDKDFSQRNFHVLIVVTLSFLGMILSTNFYVYSACLVPLAIANSIGRLVSLEMILKKSHNDHRGSLIGASNSVRSLAGVFAPMVAGVIGEYFGVTYVIYASLLSTLIGTIISYQIRMSSIKRLKVD